MPPVALIGLMSWPCVVVSTPALALVTPIWATSRDAKALINVTSNGPPVAFGNCGAVGVTRMLLFSAGIVDSVAWSWVAVVVAASVIDAELVPLNVNTVAALLTRVIF